MSTLTFGFIGLGLIGGSIARAIRQNLPHSQIIAYDINADTLSEASQCGVANTITTKSMLLFHVRLSIPLCSGAENDENLSAVKKILSPKTLLTDVGSVKSEIHKEIKKPVWKDSLSAVIPWREVTGWALLIPKPSFWRMPTTFSPPQLPFRRIRSRIIRIWCSS